MLKFLLNDQLHEPTLRDPHQSLLDYLREELLQTGTKEGCASGDCGACTVVVGEEQRGKMQYKSVNACITPVATLHGKQLITVEHLQQGRELHPVQQAMVDCHGSQCGFCTPGFVMSMFAYRKNHTQPEREEILEALGGNLCRCTGYRPIVEAAVQMYEPPLEDQFSEGEAAAIAALQGIDPGALRLEAEAGGQRYFSPTTVTELAELLLENPGARLIAGGTDLSLDATQFLKEFETLVYTGRVAELLTVGETAKTIEIGGAVSYSQCEHILSAHFPDMAELLARLGSLQIRNQGTIGGNVGNASPIGDMLPVLIALNAQLILRRGDQTREVAVEDYYLGYKSTVLEPSEFIESIVIPKPLPGYEFRVYKISKRLEDDISSTCGAFSINIKGGRVVDACIAFGGMAAIPARAIQCERALIGEPWEQGTIDSAMVALAKDYQPISDFRASADYRLTVSQNMLQRLFLELASSADQLRVTHYA